MPELPSWDASEADHFVRMQTDEDAALLLQRLNARAKMVYTKHITGIAVNGHALPPEVVSVVRQAHFNLRSATLSLESPADEDMTPLTKALGHSPIVVWRCQVENFTVNEACLTLQLRHGDAPMIYSNAQLPPMLKTLSITFDSALLVSGSASAVFTQAKRVGQPQARASVSGALIVSRSGSKVSN